MGFEEEREGTESEAERNTLETGCMVQLWVFIPRVHSLQVYSHVSLY